VSFVGSSCFATCLALAELAVDLGPSVVSVAVLGDAGHGEHAVGLSERRGLNTVDRRDVAVVVDGSAPGLIYRTV
jgi:hypothetical protein